MNLHGIVRSAIGAINPHVQAVRRRSTGFTTADDGTRTPTFDDVSVTLQVQALTFGDIQQIDGLNIQGARRAIYLDGAAFGLVRVKQVGGDMIVFPAGMMPEGDVWQCVHVLEQWPDWNKCVITLQNGS